MRIASFATIFLFVFSISLVYAQEQNDTEIVDVETLLGESNKPKDTGENTFIESKIHPLDNT